jgi:hypothetical protein
LKIVATQKSDQNRAVLDPWTVVHFASGLALGLVSAPREGSVGAALAYEVVEQWLERQRAGQEFFETAGPESVANALVDVAVFTIGHRLGTLWNRT